MLGVVEIVVVDVHGARKGEREQKVDARVERVGGAREREERARRRALVARARRRRARRQRAAPRRRAAAAAAAGRGRAAARRRRPPRRRRRSTAWSRRRRLVGRAHAVTFRHQRWRRPPDRAQKLAAGERTARTPQQRQIRASPPPAGVELVADGGVRPGASRATRKRRHEARQRGGAAVAPWRGPRPWLANSASANPPFSGLARLRRCRAPRSSPPKSRRAPEGGGEGDAEKAASASGGGCGPE